MAALADARTVTRRFGQFTAVDAVSLSVRRGEILGLLGANGAGKTTLIRLMLGLLRPSGGGIRLFGEPPSIATRRRVGYVPQTLGLYAGLTVAENWKFTAAAFGMRRGVQLPDSIAAWRKDVVGDLPLGVQRRVAFAVALSHRPELLVLDEPTSGVGPARQRPALEEIRQAADGGAGALVTTHNMEEAEQCDRLVIMAEGKVVAAGTAADITAGRKSPKLSRATGARRSPCSTPAESPSSCTGPSCAPSPSRRRSRAAVRRGHRCHRRHGPSEPRGGVRGDRGRAGGGGTEGNVSPAGRRPGTPDTREAILKVARREFATRGYDATSLRLIAAEAQVDPALVIHYFGTKDNLFIAATGLPASLPGAIANLAGIPVTTSPRLLSAPTLNSSTVTTAATPSWPLSARRYRTREPPPCSASS